MKKNYRNILILTWCLCYIIIFISYLSIIHKDNPVTNSFPRIILLFGIVSAIIVPQIGIMLSFFFEKTKEEVDSILENRPNAKLAYWFSIFYILIFTCLIVVGIPFQSLFGWKINEATNYIVLIMGHLALFITLPLKYLFK
jgi:hypothetical protein